MSELNVPLAGQHHTMFIGNEDIRLTESMAINMAIRGVAAILACIGLGTLAFTVVGRVTSPWPLEWMEGGVLHHALRFAQGEAIYVPPSADFIPYLYPPLAYLPAALMVTLGYPSLATMRCVSILWLILSLLAIARMARRGASHEMAGWAAAGMFALGFGYTGAFLDLARVDGFFIMLMACGVERLQAKRTRTGLWLLALSGLAKQHGLFLFLAASATITIRDRRNALQVVGPPLCAVMFVLWALNRTSDGWFWTYIFELPSTHGVVWPLAFTFVFVDLLLYLPVLTVSAIVLFKRNFQSWDPSIAALMAAIIVSALGRAHPGGDDNVRLPAFALLCGLALAPLLHTMLSADARRSTRLLIAALVLGQATMLWQPPSLYQPTPQSALQFSRLVNTIERCAGSEGRVGANNAVALDYPLLTNVPFMHTMALSDLSVGQGIPRLARQARHSLVERLASESAPHSIAVGNTFPQLDAALASYYTECAIVEAPRMPTGYQPPAQHIYRRKAAPCAAIWSGAGYAPHE